MDALTPPLRTETVQSTEERLIDVQYDAQKEEGWIWRKTTISGGWEKTLSYTGLEPPQSVHEANAIPSSHYNLKITLSDIYISFFLHEITRYIDIRKTLASCTDCGGSSPMALKKKIGVHFFVHHTVPTPDFARHDPNLPDPTEFSPVTTSDPDTIEETPVKPTSRQETDKFTPPTSTSSPIASPMMSHHHTLHPTPVSDPPCPTSIKTPSNRKVSFTPGLTVYGAGANKPFPVEASTFFETYEKELTRLLETGVDTKTAISTARNLAQAEQNQPTATADTLQGTTNPYPTSTLQGVTPLLAPQWGYNTPPTNPFAPSGQPTQSIAHPGFVASTPVNPPSSGQQNPHWLNTQPPSTPHPGTTSTSCPSSVIRVAIDDKNRRAQQEQAMQAFGSAAHLESALDLGNFEEARKLRLMHSKLYGEAAEEFDTFKLDNPIRSQEYAAVKARLFKLFHSTETRSKRSVEFHNMKREPEENMRRYANRIRKAFHKAYPMDGILDSVTAASREQMMMDRFLGGLPSDVQVPLKYEKFASFETLIDRAALAIEESQTRVRIHAAYSSTNASTHQNELNSVLEALNR
ncbi:hypothetical protein OUZ56_016289 [Daphnia magna]|uniref:Retrotransposon gag domain-containing protein n=1 Tax=Daphnia magna TaxID=35525 RepID=A0ABR0AQ75_9CRUS|nr:hypothetical protein OUZ56_016289 [Daphnia magna]